MCIRDSPRTGAVYLRGNKSRPKLFVIGGAGSGIPVYHALQRKNVPFAAGILMEDVYKRQVMEGVMGLYDGLGGIRKEGSSYHLAEVTKTPVILVVNAHGMGRSILPVIRGFLDYDRHHLIRGVILNQTSVTFCEMCIRDR